ncbi:MAG: hypothetical protein PHP31_02290 [Lentimicrobiaceae bacterium]|nr:hypothetical protein [Lentimicrobiaceae bacterium]
MMKLYKYLFYRLYTWNLNKWGENDLPQWNAMFIVSSMMFLNLILIGILLQAIGINIFYLEKTPKKEITFIATGLMIMNYFLFIHKGKYLEITRLLEKETPKKRKINTALIWLYVILSFTLFVIGIIILKELKGY